MRTIVVMEQTKQCSKCGEVKPLEGFVKQIRNRDGRTGKCKVCSNKEIDPIKNRARARAWAIANPDSRKLQHLDKAKLADRTVKYRSSEKYKETNRAYRIENHDRLLALSRPRQRAFQQTDEYKKRQPIYSKTHYDKHADELRLKALTNYHSDPIKGAAKSRAYYAANSDARKAYANKNIADLAPHYLANLIARGQFPANLVPPELIEAKRTHLQLVRITKQLITAIKEKQNGTK